MTIIHSELPKHKGELDLAKVIRSVGYETLQVWFSLDYIPGVRDVDIFLIDPAICAFVVEVKAISLEMIESISFKKWVITGRKPDAGPIQQAFSAGFSLRQYLESRVGNIPFIAATACFPLIYRERWNQAFSGTEFAGDFSDRLLFADDFTSGPQILSARLKFIALHPPIRAGCRLDTELQNRSRSISVRTIESIALALDPEGRPKPTVSDWERLKVIEQGISADTLKSFPTSDQHYCLFTGLPGTGKTFRLLQLLFANAFDGKRALFCCYNKTLASDIRRLLHFSDKLKHAHEYPVILDIFELAAQDFQALGLPYLDSKDHDEWLSLVVDELRARAQSGVVNGFDIIVMDEAQELNRAERELLISHMNPACSLFFALGQGQEIYRDREVFSKEDALALFASLDGTVKPTRKDLRRNFRNTRSVYFAAHIFYECYPHLDKIEDELARLQERTKKNQIALDFDRESGGTIEIFTVDSSSLPTPDSFSFPQQQEEFMSSAYLDFIEREFDLLTEQHSPIDLLVLVPTENSVITSWAQMGLKRFQSKRGIPFTDLTIEHNRRQLGDKEKIRLCTFHSSRGLEGARVLIFGFEQVDLLSTRLGFKTNNLGFIILSRSLFSTTLVFGNSSSQSKQMVEKIALSINRHSKA